MLTKSLLLTSIALCLSFAAAKAQVFSTGTITGDADVETVGAVVDAYAFNYSGIDFTVNGVNFTSTSNINGTYTGYTFNGPGIDGTGGGIVPSSTGGQDTNLSTNLQDLLGNGVHNYGGGDALELTGLTSGQTYSLQLFINSNSHDSRSQAWSDGAAVSNPVTTGGNEAGNPGVNDGDNTGYDPAYITDVFTAMGTTHTVDAVYSGTSAQLSGFVLEVAPEPSTWALMGLSLAGLAFLARRSLPRS